MIFKGNFVLLSLILFFGFFHSDVSLAEGRKAVFTAVGQYLVTHDYLEKFGRSECGYVLGDLVPGKRFGGEQAMNEMLSILNTEELNGIRSLLQGEKWKRKQRKHSDMLRGMINEGKKKSNPQTACGSIYGMFMTQHQLYWEELLKLTR